MVTAEKKRRGRTAFGTWAWFCRQREAQGLTLTQVAERLGVSFATVSQWERKEHRPTWGYHQSIADLFGVPVDALHRELSSW